jgi:hypothetical protein
MLRVEWEELAKVFVWRYAVTGEIEPNMLRKSMSTLNKRFSIF